MKIPAKVYKLSLVLKAPKKGKVCLLEGWEDIVQIKDEYNATHDNKIFLLKPRLNRLNLLYGVFGRGSFNPRYLRPFADTINRELYASRKKSGSENGFDLKASQLISPGELAILLNDLRINEPEYFNIADYCMLLPTATVTGEDVDGDDRDREERDRERNGGRNNSELERLSLDDSLEKLDSLVGMDPFKEEIRRVVNVVRTLKSRNKKKDDSFPLSCSYIVSVEKGMEMSTALQLVANIFYHLGIISSRKIYEMGPDQLNTLSFRFFNTITGPEFGLFGVYDLDRIKEEDPEDEKRIIQAAKKVKDKKVFFFVFAPEQEKEQEQFKSVLSQQLDVRTIQIPPMTDEELLEIARRKLDGYNCELAPEAEEKLKLLIKTKRDLGTFENIHTVESIIRNGVMNKLFAEDQGDGGHEGTLQLDASNLQQDEPVKVSVSLQESEGMQELEHQIGLEPVKEKIKEIVQHLLLEAKRNEVGLAGEKLCYHMLFTGNPGTGKTTVARIIGKIFSEVGLLEKGGFQEASREHLVARYVGHTALKTSELVKNNIGSVLFIDEAYSLNDGTSTNFGQEALDTLVRQMENNRDKMVIILAGYTEEMEKLMERNPGLKDRIPHRIDFPDYSGDELLQIFRNLLGEECPIDEAAEKELAKLFKKAVSRRDKHFGNGRFARNVVERIKLKQARRIDVEGELDKDGGLTVTLDDVLALYEDKDILEQTGKGGKKRGKWKRIGFIWDEE